LVVLYLEYKGRLEVDSNKYLRFGESKMEVVQEPSLHLTGKSVLGIVLELILKNGEYLKSTVSF